MSLKASQPGPGDAKVKVRFLGSVKSGGRWYENGEVATITDEVSLELEKKGLIERLESKPRNIQTKGKGGSRALSRS